LMYKAVTSQALKEIHKELKVSISQGGGISMYLAQTLTNPNPSAFRSQTRDLNRWKSRQKGVVGTVRSWRLQVCRLKILSAHFVGLGCAGPFTSLGFKFPTP
jgi:hypothetical protein